jgi:hypothetical protein
VRIAVTWLNQEQPTEAVPLQLVIEQAKAQPLGEHRRPSLHEAVNKVDNVNFTEAKGGNSTQRTYIYPTNASWAAVFK